MYKYWRMALGFFQGSAPNVTYLTMYSISGGNNIISGGSAAHSFESSSANNIFVDSSSALALPNFTAYSRTPEPTAYLGYAAVGYQFPSPVSVVEMGIRMSTTGKLGDIRIEASTDGVKWVTKALVREIDVVANTLVKVSIPEVFDIPMPKAVRKYINRKPSEDYFPPISGRSIIYPIWKTHFGKYRIYGTTTAQGFRAPRQVFLMDTLSGAVLDGQWTNDNGEFSFNGIRMGNYTVLGIDKTLEQNSIVYSHIEPVE